MTAEAADVRRPGREGTEPPTGAPADGGRRAGGAASWAASAEIAIGVLAVAVVLGPVLAHLTDRLAGATDARYSAWLSWRVGRLWADGHLLTLTIPDALAPMGFDLKLIDGLAPVGVGALFGVASGGNAFFGYNAALAAGLGLDVWAGRRLALVLSPRRWVALAAGVAFATTPLLATSARAHIAFVYAFPVALLLREAIVVARGERPLRAPATGGLLVLAFLCSAYYLIFGALLMVLALALWPRSAVWSRPNLTRLGGAFAIAVLALSPFIVARVGYERAERAAGAPAGAHLDESVSLSADALDAVTPPEGMLVPLPGPHLDVRGYLFPDLRPAFAGYALLAGAGVLALTRRPERRALLGAAAVLWALSLGPAVHVAGRLLGADPAAGSAGAPEILPFHWLVLVPGLGALRAPIRVGYALAAIGTGAFALGLDRVASWSGRRTSATRAGVVAGTIALLVISMPGAVPTTDLDLHPDTRAGLAEIAARSAGSGDRVDGLLIVPWGCRFDDPRLVLLQSVHTRPWVGCVPATSAVRWYSDLEPWVDSKELAALRCDPTHLEARAVPFDASVRLGGRDGVDRMRRDLGVRYVIIDRLPLMAPGCFGPVDAARVLAGYETVSDDGSWQLVDLDHPIG